jgi:anti-anti-sigma factor
MGWTCIADGEIDRATAPALDVELRDTIDQAEEAVVYVDCSGVTFMDPAGFRVLVDATQYAMRRGHTLVIRNMSPSCARLVELCDRDLELRLEHCGQGGVRMRHALSTPVAESYGYR